MSQGSTRQAQQIVANARLKNAIHESNERPQSEYLSDLQQERSHSCCEDSEKQKEKRSRNPIGVKITRSHSNNSQRFKASSSLGNRLRSPKSTAKDMYVSNNKNTVTNRTDMSTVKRGPLGGQRQALHPGMTENSIVFERYDTGQLTTERNNQQSQLKLGGLNFAQIQVITKESEETSPKDIENHIVSFKNSHSAMLLQKYQPEQPEEKSRVDQRHSQPLYKIQFQQRTEPDSYEGYNNKPTFLYQESRAFDGSLPMTNLSHNRHPSMTANQGTGGADFGAQHTHQRQQSLGSTAQFLQSQRSALENMEYNQEQIWLKKYTVQRMGDSSNASMIKSMRTNRSGGLAGPTSNGNATDLNQSSEFSSIQTFFEAKRHDKPLEHQEESHYAESQPQVSEPMIMRSSNKHEFGPQHPKQHYFNYQQSEEYHHQAANSRNQEAKWRQRGQQTSTGYRTEPLIDSRQNETEHEQNNEHQPFYEQLQEQQHQPEHQQAVCSVDQRQPANDDFNCRLQIETQDDSTLPVDPDQIYKPPYSPVVLGSQTHQHHQPQQQIHQQHHLQQQRFSHRNEPDGDGEQVEEATVEEEAGVSVEDVDTENTPQNMQSSMSLHPQHTQHSSQLKNLGTGKLSQPIQLYQHQLMQEQITTTTKKTASSAIDFSQFQSHEQNGGGNASNSSNTFVKQIALLVSREKVLMRENAELRQLNQNMMSHLSMIESQLAEERQNSNLLQYESQRLIVNLEKSQQRAARAENTLEEVDKQVLLVEQNTKAVEHRARQAEKNSNKWHQRHNQVKKELDETREMIVMYEGLVNKLTEQNGKLKAIVKQKKQRKRSQPDSKSLIRKVSNGGIAMNDQSIFDVQMATSDGRRSASLQSGSRSARSENYRAGQSKRDSKFERVQPLANILHHNFNSQIHSTSKQQQQQQKKSKSNRQSSRKDSKSGENTFAARISSSRQSLHSKPLGSQNASSERRHRQHKSATHLIDLIKNVNHQGGIQHKKSCSRSKSANRRHKSSHSSRSQTRNHVQPATTTPRSISDLIHQRLASMEPVERDLAYLRDQSELQSENRLLKAQIDRNNLLLSQSALSPQPPALDYMTPTAFNVNNANQRSSSNLQSQTTLDRSEKQENSDIINVVQNQTFANERPGSTLTPSLPLRPVDNHLPLQMEPAHERQQLAPSSKPTPYFDPKADGLHSGVTQSEEDTQPHTKRISVATANFDEMMTRQESRDHHQIRYYAPHTSSISLARNDDQSCNEATKNSQQEWPVSTVETSCNSAVKISTRAVVEEQFAASRKSHPLKVVTAYKLQRLSNGESINKSALGTTFVRGSSVSRKQTKKSGVGASQSGSNVAASKQSASSLTQHANARPKAKIVMLSKPYNAAAADASSNSSRPRAAHLKGKRPLKQPVAAKNAQANPKEDQKPSALKKRRKGSLEPDFEEVIPVVNWGYPEDYIKKHDKSTLLSKRSSIATTHRYAQI